MAHSWVEWRSVGLYSGLQLGKLLVSRNLQWGTVEVSERSSDVQSNVDFEFSSEDRFISVSQTNQNGIVCMSMYYVLCILVTNITLIVNARGQDARQDLYIFLRCGTTIVV